MLAGVVSHGFDHDGIVNQPVHQHLPFGELERADFDVQAGADLLDYPVDAPAQELSAAGNQHPVQHRDHGHGNQHDKHPDGDGDFTGQ
ncbi:MAG: hypothetical protein KQI81_06355 [Deltaproteobacteria bacterium]|nr:hypothetical protein [Deltaproteobacteria bacterium]